MIAPHQKHVCEPNPVFQSPDGLAQASGSRGHMREWNCPEKVQSGRLSKWQVLKRGNWQHLIAFRSANTVSIFLPALEGFLRSQQNEQLKSRKGGRTYTRATRIAFPKQHLGFISVHPLLSNARALSVHPRHASCGYRGEAVEWSNIVSGEQSCTLGTQPSPLLYFCTTCCSQLIPVETGPTLLLTPPKA